MDAGSGRHANPNLIGCEVQGPLWSLLLILNALHLLSRNLSFFCFPPVVPWRRLCAARRNTGKVSRILIFSSRVDRLYSPP